ncbi:MAG TPA: hypothetical protein PLX79_03400 [Candidatus Dojkabacteria bacterium]|nr:hypothetical protein [Candidatus Dojkabacteria bacterium]
MAKAKNVEKKQTIAPKNLDAKSKKASTLDLPSDAKKTSVKSYKKAEIVKEKSEQNVSKKQAHGISDVSIRIEWIVILLLLITMVFALITQGFTQPLFVSKASANKILTKINDGFFGGENIAVSAKFDRKSGYYNVDLESNGQTGLLYVTTDKKYVMTSESLIEIPESTEVLGTQSTEVQKTDTPSVYLFTMSYCPYGNIADEFTAPVYNLLKDRVNFEPHYVIYSGYASQMGADWSGYCTAEDENYCSMHGIQELNQDVRELCIWKYDKDKYWDFVLDVNTACDYTNVDSCWTDVAKKYGIDTDQINKCQTEEKDSLLAKEVELNTQYNVAGSPHIVVNDAEYSGNRDAESFKQFVCSAFNNSPESCATVLDSAASTASGSCN